MVRRRLWGFWVVLLLIAALIHAWYLRCAHEDAFISYRFARHLADGYGLIWNIGQPPVEGFTNFLWVLLCAAAMRIGLPVVPFAQMAGALCAAVIVLYTVAFAQRVLALDRWRALLAGTLVAAAGPIAAWAASGMETTCFGMWLLMGCFHYARGLVVGSRRHLLFGTVGLLMATLTRPEGLLIFVVVQSMTIVVGAEHLSRRTLVMCAGAYLLPLAAYFIWRASYFGYLLPNTFYAKVGWSLFEWVRGAGYAAFFALHFLFPLAWIPLLLYGERTGPGLCSAPAVRKSFMRHLKTHVGLGMCAAVVVAFTAYIIFVGGDYMPMYRFFAPILPLAYLPAAAGAQRLMTSTSSTPYRHRMYVALLCLSLAGILVHSTCLEEWFYAKTPFTHGNYRGIRQAPWYTARYKLIGQFFREYKRDTRESIYTSAIGIIAYYSELTVYGKHGLVQPEVAHAPSSWRRGWYPAGHQRDGLPFALSQKPTFLMFNAVLTDEPLSYPDVASPLAELIRQEYEVRSVFLNDTENGEAGYFTFLQRKDRDLERPEAP